MEKDYYIVRQKIEVRDEATGASLVLPDDDFSIDAMIDFDSPVLNNQYATLDNLAEFPKEIAASPHICVRARG